jgi:hypothetical protein
VTGRSLHEAGRALREDKERFPRSIPVAILRKLNCQVSLHTLLSAAPTMTTVDPVSGAVRLLTVAELRSPGFGANSALRPRFRYFFGSNFASMECLYSTSKNMRFSDGFTKTCVYVVGDPNRNYFGTPGIAAAMQTAYSVCHSDISGNELRERPGRFQYPLVIGIDCYVTSNGSGERFVKEWTFTDNYPQDVADIIMTCHDIPPPPRVANITSFNLLKWWHMVRFERELDKGAVQADAGMRLANDERVVNNEPENSIAGRLRSSRTNTKRARKGRKAKGMGGS